MGEGAAAKGGPADLWRLLIVLADLELGLGRLGPARETAEHALRHATRERSSRGRGRVCAFLANLCGATGDHAQADAFRQRAIEEMRLTGDRRSTADLLFAAAGTGEFRVGPLGLEEARRLAAEVEWEDPTTASGLIDEPTAPGVTVEPEG
jgi:hypothetical protein